MCVFHWSLTLLCPDTPDEYLQGIRVTEWSTHCQEFGHAAVRVCLNVCECFSIKGGEQRDSQHYSSRWPLKAVSPWSFEKRKETRPNTPGCACVCVCVHACVYYVELYEQYRMCHLLGTRRCVCSRLMCVRVCDRVLALGDGVTDLCQTNHLHGVGEHCCQGH